MRAIVTTYHAPTDTRGSRIVASDSEGHRAHIAYNDAPSDDEAHRMAAETLIRKMNWGGLWKSGGLKHGRAWVCVKPGGDLHVEL